MEIFVLLLVIVVVVWLYRRSMLARAAPPPSGPKASPAASAVTTSPEGMSIPRPDAWMIPARLVRLSADGRMSVVGESHYQPALQHITGGKDCHGDFANAVAVSAVLVPEPTNPYDRNAVRVDIDRMTVGYLAREDAVDYQPPLRALQSRGALGWCPAFVMGGGDRLYGVFMHLGPPDRLVAVTSADGLYLLPAERMAAVTGEEKHQDVLEEIAARGGGTAMMSVIASLHACTITRGKYTGETGIEVRSTACGSGNSPSSSRTGTCPRSVAWSRPGVSLGATGLSTQPTGAGR
jgi:hypothetical protein